MSQTLNDKAWIRLFERYDILQSINENGFYEIKAKTIKEEREPRLMAKFDHKKNLPEIFKKYGLSILPVSRSKYIIGAFNAFKKVYYDMSYKPKTFYFPGHITTIDPHNLYSESAALHCASLTGMIDEVLGEEAVQTISGRMSSKLFNFNISTYNGIETEIQINNSQVEIDAGYESSNYFMLIEAKKETVDDFLIRQLYYPYRLWDKQTTKKVVPVFFTHSNDIFSFFIYDFENPNNYNSLILKEQKHFMLVHENIDFPDIQRAFYETTSIEEPRVPFPQADSFTRVVDLLGQLVNKDMSKEEITLGYDFDARQTNYYTDACRYLGLVEKYYGNQTAMFRLTDKARNIMLASYKEKYLGLVKSILEHEPFRRTYEEYLTNRKIPSRQRVIDIMKQCQLYNVQAESTYKRRSSTILGWINWITNLTEF